jgi:hypothetical protein
LREGGARSCLSPIGPRPLVEASILGKPAPRIRPRHSFANEFQTVPLTSACAPPAGHAGPCRRPCILACRKAARARTARRCVGYCSRRSSPRQRTPNLFWPMTTTCASAHSGADSALFVMTVPLFPLLGGRRARRFIGCRSTHANSRRLTGGAGHLANQVEGLTLRSDGVSSRSNRTRSSPGTQGRRSHSERTSARQSTWPTQAPR